MKPPSYNSDSPTGGTGEEFSVACFGERRRPIPVGYHATVTAISTLKKLTLHEDKELAEHAKEALRQVRGR